MPQSYSPAQYSGSENKVNVTFKFPFSEDLFVENGVGYGSSNDGIKITGPIDEEIFNDSDNEDPGPFYIASFRWSQHQAAFVCEYDEYSETFHLFELIEFVDGSVDMSPEMIEAIGINGIQIMPGWVWPRGTTVGLHVHIRFLPAFGEPAKQAELFAEKRLTPERERGEEKEGGDEDKMEISE